MKKAKLSVYALLMVLASFAYANEPPSATGLNVIPENPTLGDNLICNYTYYDLEGYEEKDSTYFWRKNGIDQNINSQLLWQGNLSLNDKWSCEVIPSDGLLNGTKVSSPNVTILSTVSNSKMYIESNLFWNVSGYFSDTYTIKNFSEQLQEIIDSCIPDNEGFCNVTLDFSSDTSGILNLSELEIYYMYKEPYYGPQIKSEQATPTVQGFGENVTITASITDPNGTQDIRDVLVGIVPPNETEKNYSMYNISSNVWQYVFTDFSNGTYTYSIYANDSSGISNKKSDTFTMFVDLYSNIKTLKDNYSNHEYVNITDPPHESGSYTTNILISRDTAWKILKQDYISKYIDFNFSYVNDTYYRVDWRWNNDYVRRVIHECFDQENVDNDCIQKLSLEYFPQEIIKEEIIEENITETVMPSAGGNEDTPNEQSNPIYINIKKSKRINVTSNFSYQDFADKFFPQFSSSRLRTHISFLNERPMPYAVLQGRAKIIGNIQVMNGYGFFYINLVDGFDNSNGLQIRWDFNTTIAEFNNGKTEENLTFAGNQNITRYLQLSRYSVVSSASLSLKGYPTADVNLGNGSDGALIFTTTTKSYGNLVYGVDYTVSGSTLYLMLNRVYQFTDFTLGTGTTISTNNNTGVGLFIKANGTAVLSGEVDLSNKADYGQKDLNFTLDGTTYFFPGVASGGGAPNGGGQGYGFGGGGGGSFSGCDNVHCDPPNYNGAYGANGNTPFGSGGTGGSHSGNNFNSGSPGVAGTEGSGAGGGADSCCHTGDGSASCTAGSGGNSYGANGGDGSGSWTCGGGYCWVCVDAGGGGGAGGRAGKGGYHFVLKGKTINFGGTITLSGTNGQNGGNGGRRKDIYNNVWFDCGGYGGGGGGGGNSGDVSFMYSSIEYSNTITLMGGIGGDGGLRYCVSSGWTASGDGGSDGSYGTYLSTQFSNPTNPYLEIGTPGSNHEWNYSGEFKATETTQNLSLAINSALNNGLCDCQDCSMNGSNCSIPFIFHSDQAGIIEYSNINIIYEDENKSQSKIRNYGTTNASIYLLMKVQFWNNSDWIDDGIIQNDSSLRKIFQGKINQIKLDQIWNPKSWPTNNNNYGSGVYRVYVAGIDENDKILYNKDGTEIVAFYNFTLNSSGPLINSITALPNPQGFGENVTITANITDINGTQDIDTVLVGIIPPGENETNYTMYNVSSSTWQYIFTDFTNGTYQYTVYANDSSGVSDSKSGTFEMYVDLFINIKTLKDNYTNNEFVNITDPSEGYSFNNSKTAENLTFTGNENISRYLTVPLEITVNNFNMTLASYEKNSTCYQEFSNVTVECNNATLKGSYDGSGYQWIDLYKAMDGDYSTNASCDPSFGCAIYFNYTLERNITLALWQIGNETHIVNKTLPQNCIDYANSVNKLQFEMTSNSLPGTARYHCHIDAVTTTLVYQYNSINVYEEGIFLITNTPPVSNPYLVIDTSHVWNYSGTFTGPNITNNLSSFINEALNNSKCNCSNCWSNGTHCTIQFLFHSDTAGILEYSNINLDYEAEDFSESKIRNDASINTSLYLLMKVQYWNTSNWLDEATIQNDSSPRRIQPGEINQLKLDSIWNPNAWYTNYNKYGSGLYRAYVATTDENDNILLNKDGTPIISSYNFTLNVTIPDDNKKFIIKNESGDIRAWFGDKGNIILKGICLALADCIPPANSFIIQNLTGETVAYIDSSGNLCIEKGDCSDLSTYCNASNGLIITNSTDIISYIDMEGDLCLTGKLYLYS